MHSLDRCDKVNRLVMPTTHACPHRRTTLSALVCVLMAVAGADKVWALPATDAQGQAAVLALASKAIAQDTGGAAALLEPLTVKGGIFTDYALYLTVAANRDNPQAQRQALQRLLSEHPGSPLYGPAMAELAAVLYKLGDFAAVDELSLRPATTDLAAPEAARLWMAAGKALAGRDDAKATTSYRLSAALLPKYQCQCSQGFPSAKYESNI